MRKTPPDLRSKTPTAPPRRFGPGKRALAQRRALLLGVKLLLLALLWLLGLVLKPPLLSLILLKWAGLGALGWALWQVPGRAVLRSLEERELLLHDLALELRRGDFKRFVVYASLRHVVVTQGSAERLVSLRLDLDDDSVLLRDLDGLPEAFAAVAGAKPDQAVIEIDERRVDWGEPLPWVLAALGAGLLLAALALRLRV